MLKQAFRRGEKLQKEVVLLSNAFSNRFDHLVNTSDKEDVISRCRTRNVTSPQLLGTGRIRVAGSSERGEEIGNVNGDMSEVCFLD